MLSQARIGLSPMSDRGLFEALAQTRCKSLRRLFKSEGRTRCVCNIIEEIGYCLSVRFSLSDQCLLNFSIVGNEVLFVAKRLLTGNFRGKFNTVKNFGFHILISL